MASFSISHLRCEYLDDPLGIDEVQPRLSWLLEGQRRGLGQSAYRILVASSSSLLAKGAGDLWDSGRISSDQNTQVVYSGEALQSRMECHWLVEVWDELGELSRSKASRWTMGLLQEKDWDARWIAADPAVIQRDPEAKASTYTQCGTPVQFRRDFSVGGQVRKAILYTTARGLVEIELGGRRVGQDQFVPEWTDYDKRIQYRSYEVTELLTRGPNALGVYLGDGWYSGYVGWQETRGRYGLENSFLLQLEIELEDGTKQLITSDSSWRCNTGALLQSDFMMGEAYDARREQRGWSQPGFDDKTWLPARELESPKIPLVSQRSEPVRITETLSPRSITQVAPDVFICDFGQNLTGWIHLQVRGKRGQKLTLRHGERLNPDGTLYTENLRRALSTDVLILSGQSTESWQPRFTFHGFQYLEISGLGAKPTADMIKACVVHSATPPAGHFECPHADVNRLWLNGYWSQRDNFLSVPTDCPQRDERLGWMGDAQVFLRTASCNMDVAAFFTKWMRDVIDAQTPEGVFPDVAPRLKEGENFIGLDGLGGAAGWADAGVIVPWTIWRVYGDKRIIERSWSAMVAWLEYLERTNPDGHRVNELANNYGDWLCIPSDTTFRTHSPMKNLLATAYWADDAAKVSRMARELGKHEEATRFDKMFQKVRAAFQKHYVLPDGKLNVETQTAYLLALSMHLLPDKLRAAAAGHLVENIKALDWHLSTGFIGISHLNPTLTLSGYADVAYRLLLQDTYPSWLYPIKHGATTIWERWNGWTHQDGFFNPQMNSFNHYSLGSIGEWLFRHVAGIELDAEQAGYKHFQLRPFPSRSLGAATARYRSIQGEIRSAWSWEGDRFQWTIVVPPNTRARVLVPTSNPDSVNEAGRPLQNVPGLRVIGEAQDSVVCEAPSGRYVFFSTLK